MALDRHSVLEELLVVGHGLCPYLGPDRCIYLDPCRNLGPYPDLGLDLSPYPDN